MMTQAPHDSATPSTAIDVDVLDRYQRAWAENDVEGIVALMTPDGLYEASFGPEPWGERFVGRDAIRAGILRNQKASRKRSSTHEYGQRWVLDDVAFADWMGTWVEEDGTPGAVCGFDIFRFRDGLVSEKIAYRKGR